MQRQRISASLSTVALIVLISLAIGSSAGAAEFKTLHKFKVSGDARNSMAELVFDSAGNLYGTTARGGIHKKGAVFQLSPNPDGTWTEKVLHSFADKKHGWHPNAGVILDAAGNLYGTTKDVGAYNRGTVFELVSNPDGSWTEKLLHEFRWDNRDGGNPMSRLLWDADGSLYGTTYRGGAHNEGTVFKLTPNPDAGWTEDVIYDLSDGEIYAPRSGLISDASGNLYGTASYGAFDPFTGGGVFRLTRNPDGTWIETVIYGFPSYEKGGVHPYGGVVFDAAGNLYGTTLAGGKYGYGVVFRLKPTPSGRWRERVLHAFRYQEPSRPMAGVIFDAAGNLYGTTSENDFELIG